MKNLKILFGAFVALILSAGFASCSDDDDNGGGGASDPESKYKFDLYVCAVKHGGMSSRGTTARSVSLSWGAREVGSPCEWRGGARHCSRAMVGESGLETC